ncbi:MAG TPA: acetyltransferase [Methylomirabilota bacterium]|nr:acetyltransferase [Methylomirabilota bacterium]
MSKVVLFGNARFAETNYFYLTHDSEHDVAAFTVDRAYIQGRELLACPVVPFEEITQHYPPEEYLMAAPLGLKRVNHLRAEKFQQAQAKGYRLVTYVSSRAVTWPGAAVGENCYVYENAVLKPFARVGRNVIIETGSVVGHHTDIQDHCFLGPNSVVLGECIVEPYCIIGANAMVREGVTIATGCIIGAGALITRNTRPGGVYLAPTSELLPGSSAELSALLEAR